MEKLSNLFRKVKLLILDVDGVLTKGEIIYDSSGKELKVFNVKDGLGVYIIGKAGIKVVLLTAKDSKAVRKRAHDMGADLYGGVLPKEKVLSVIKKKYNVTDKEICFVGDDLIDIGVMRKVGLPIAVKDAPEDVRKAAVYVTKHKGGEGAVREVIERILKSKGLWEKSLKKAVFS